MLSFFKKFAERKENKEDDGTAKGFMSHCRAAISNALFVNAIGLTYLICKDTETISFAHDKSSTDPTKVNSEVPVLWLRTEMGMVIAAAFLKKEGAKQTVRISPSSLLFTEDEYLTEVTSAFAPQILCSHGNAEDMGKFHDVPIHQKPSRYCF